MNFFSKFLCFAFLAYAVAVSAYGKQKVPARLTLGNNSLIAEWTHNNLPVNVLINPNHGCKILNANYTVTSKGNIVIVWSEKSNKKGESDIFAKMFTPTGRNVWKNKKLPVNVFRGNQTLPKIAPALDGGFFVVWQSDSAGKNNINIWCQRFLENGIQAWITPVPVCAFSGNQINPIVITDIDGSILVAWEDYRKGNADIYGQRIEQDGSFTGPEDGMAIDSSPGNQTSVKFVIDKSGQPVSLKWKSIKKGFSNPVIVETDISKMPLPEPAVISILLFFVFLLRKNTLTSLI